MGSFAPQTRTPGVVQQVVLEKDVGLADLPRRVALVGYRSTAAGNVSDDVPVVVDSRADAQAYFGAGSQLDLMIRDAFATGNLARQAIPAGGNPEILAVALAPPAGFTAAYTVTFAGAATANGVVTLHVNEQTVSFQVLAGDAAATVASSADAALETVENELPLTGAAVAAVLTLTVREPGEWGNDVYLAVDTSQAPGVTAVIAQSVVGVGVVSVTNALTALQDETFVGIYAVSQSDATTRAAVLADIQECWTFATDRPRHAVFPVVGDASDGETAAAAIDDYRVIVSVGEKFVGVGQPYGPDSARSSAACLGAALATRLYTRSRPNANYNRARIAGQARDFDVTRQELDDAINGGVTMLVNGERSGGAEIVRAVTSAVTDQTPGGSGPDKRWQPFEVTHVIQEIWWQTRALLDAFTRQDRTARTVAEAKQAALGLLRAAQREGWIIGVTNDSAIVTIEVNAATQLLIDYSYTVTTNLDVVAVTHRVRRG